MLRKIKDEEFEKYIDFIYEIAMNPATASYPVFYDGIKTKDDFINESRKYKNNNEDILIFIDKDEVSGWIHYYYLPKEKYISAYTFLFKSNVEKAINQFIKFVAKNFKDYTLHLGFPYENINVINHLIKQKVMIDEESNYTVISLNDYQYQIVNLDYIEISELTYPIFESIHKRFESNMYWSSDKIFENLDKWKIYVLKDNKRIVATIYALDESMLYEVFGIDLIGGSNKENYQKELIIILLNELKKINVKWVCYMASDKEIEPLKKLGFKLIGKYYSFSKNF